MRISDWSSDVCSADLAGIRRIGFFGDDAFLPCIAHEAQQLFPLPYNMVGILDHRVALAGDQAAKPFLAQYIGEPGEILAVDLQQVENKIGEALAARFQRCLQSGKIGLSRSEEHTSELQSLMRTS